MKQISLYILCGECDGHGRIPGSPGAPRTLVCPSCRGLGFSPTEEGRAILGLVKAAGVEGLLPEPGV